MNKLLTSALALIMLLAPLGAHARFTQADTWQGNEFQPITLNKYTYANADPVRYTDPSGNIATISGLMAAINVRGTLSTTATSSFRVSVKKIGKELACIAIEEAVTDLIMQKLTGGIYIFADQNNTPYVGQTNNFDRRIQEHSRNQVRKVERVLAMFHMPTDRNDLRVVEQFFMDLYRNEGIATSNQRNAIAPNPASNNSQRLRRMVDRLDFCR